MKIAIILSALALVSGNVFAGELTGAAAKKAYDGIKGFEYSAAGITGNLEYRLTVRHNDSIECQKEETRYTSSEVIVTEYRCLDL